MEIMEEYHDLLYRGVLCTDYRDVCYYLDRSNIVVKLMYFRPDDFDLKLCQIFDFENRVYIIEKIYYHTIIGRLIELDNFKDIIYKLDEIDISAEELLLKLNVLSLEIENKLNNNDDPPLPKPTITEL